MCGEDSPAECLRYVHQAVKKTRGLVSVVATYSYKDKTWSLCGIGNIAARITGPVFSKNYISYNGIVGMNVPTTLNNQIIDAAYAQYIILCSDGIKSRWDISKYPHIFRYDLSILAAAIYKDYARKTDDMSVIIAKVN